MRLFRYTLFAPLLLAAAAVLHAQPFRTVPVGLEPATLFYDASTARLHVLNVGVDRNFNGVYEADSGDVSAAWYVVDPFTGAKLDSALMNGFFSGFPLRVGVDLAGRHLYACVGNSVNEYDIDNLDLVRGIWQGYFSGVSYDSANKLVLMHERPGFTDPGRLVAYNQAENRVEFVLPTAVNPQMTLNLAGRTSPRVENYTLCEGVFGQPNSTISYTMYVEDDFSTVNGNTLGTNATTMVQGLNAIYIAVADKMQVRVIDAASGVETPVSPIDLEGTANLGPSVMQVLSSSVDGSDSILFVGMRDGRVYRYDAATGAPLDSVALGGIVNAMTLHDTTLFVGLDLGEAPYGRVVAVGMTSHTPYDTLPTSLVPLALYGDARGDLQLVGYTVDPAFEDVAVVRQVFNGGAKQSDDTLRVGDVFPGDLLPSSIIYDFFAGPSSDSLFIAYSDSLLVYGGAGGSSAHTAIDTFLQQFPVPRSLAFGGGTGFVGGAYLLVGDGPRVQIYDRLSQRSVGMFNAQGTPVAMATTISEHGGGGYNTRALLALTGTHLTRVEFQPNVFPDSVQLGNGANHMFMYGSEAGDADGIAIITMNGSHEIVAADPFNGIVYGRAPTLTSGFDGPREAVALLNTERIVFTTNTGDVRILDQDGNVSDSLAIGGRGEAIALINDSLLAITRPFGLGFTYPPDSALLLLNPANIGTSDVRRDNAVAGAGVALEECAPNPASATTRVRIAVPRAGTVQLRVIDARGHLVATPINQTMESGTWSAQLDVSALPAGNYLLVVNHPAGQAQRTLRVVR